ncbi:hypothetical protein M231_04540 [Tremella mesenterica]|uniref:Uncharacterized protein n=1 Tax=Tremella mesenterica TaxID=5217 RepID=A0A4Q1BKF9_TREME|nr:hypothetical protein M231_04540 [Tremella mesenterica]
MSSTPLLPTLYAILPSSSHTQTLARLSLLAIHVETLDLQDDIYLAIQPVLPGRRTLRIRTKRIIKHLPKKNPSERLDIGEMDERKEQYEIVYLSSPLSGREYSSVNVRACQSLDVVGFVDKDEVVGFVEGLGFSHSHSFKQKGTLFHIPIPGIPMTFHLSVTQLIPLSSSSIQNNQINSGGLTTPSTDFTLSDNTQHPSSSSSNHLQETQSSTPIPRTSSHSSDSQIQSSSPLNDMNQQSSTPIFLPANPPIHPDDDDDIQIIQNPQMVQNPKIHQQIELEEEIQEIPPPPSNTSDKMTEEEAIDHTRQSSGTSIVSSVHTPTPAPRNRMEGTRIVVEKESERTERTERGDQRVGNGKGEKKKDLNDYLIQLYPSRPVHTVSSNQEPDLQSMMNLLSDLTGKLDWLEWGSGR